MKTIDNGIYKPSDDARYNPDKKSAHPTKFNST